MRIFEGLTLLFGFIQAMSFLFTSYVAWRIYKRQRQDADENHKREARVQLTQAWFQLDSEILRSPEASKNAHELMFPEYDIDQLDRILFMYLMLSTLNLQWNLYRDGRHPEEEWKKTLDLIIGRITRNVRIRGRDTFLVDNFEEIFGDYAEDFKKTVRDCIDRHTET